MHVKKAKKSKSQILKKPVKDKAKDSKTTTATAKATATPSKDKKQC